MICGDCEHFSPCSNFIPTHGICKEHEATVYQLGKACCYFCKKRSDRDAECMDKR